MTTKICNIKGHCWEFSPEAELVRKESVTNLSGDVVDGQSEKQPREPPDLGLKLGEAIRLDFPSDSVRKKEKGESIAQAIISARSNEDYLALSCFGAHMPSKSLSPSGLHPGGLLQHEPENVWFKLKQLFLHS